MSAPKPGGSAVERAHAACPLHHDYTGQTCEMPEGPALVQCDEQHAAIDLAIAEARREVIEKWGHARKCGCCDLGDDANGCVVLVKHHPVRDPRCAPLEKEEQGG